MNPVLLSFQFDIPAKVAGEKTAAQIKAPIKDVLMTYGAVDEIRVAAGPEGAGKTVTVVIVKNLLAKGQALKAALDKKEEAAINVWDTKFVVRAFAQATSSAGGAFSGTSQRKGPEKRGGRGGGDRGGRGGRGGSEDGGRGGRGGAGRGGKGDDKKGSDDKKADKKGKK